METLTSPYLVETELKPTHVSLLAGRANIPLACEIGRILKMPVYQSSKGVFADGESNIQIPDCLRRKSVYIIQPTSPPVNDTLIELFLMIDAARRASAGEINLVIPYFGYARQDRKDKPRVPISAALVAKFLQYAGATRILTLDIHSEQTSGAVRIPWDNLFASYSFVPVIKETIDTSNLVVASPDKGGASRTAAVGKRLGVKDLAICYKERDVNVQNESKALMMIGDVKGRDVLFVDDIYDTVGTIKGAATLALERGARHIYAAATHGIFSRNDQDSDKDAIANINGSPIEKFFVTDSIVQPADIVENPKIRIVSVAPLLAEAIRRIHTGESISDGLIE